MTSASPRLSITAASAAARPRRAARADSRSSAIALKAVRQLAQLGRAVGLDARVEVARRRGAGSRRRASSSGRRSRPTSSSDERERGDQRETPGDRGGERRARERRWRPRACAARVSRRLLRGSRPAAASQLARALAVDGAAPRAVARRARPRAGARPALGELRPSVAVGRRQRAPAAARVEAPRRVAARRRAGRGCAARLSSTTLGREQVRPRDLGARRCARARPRSPGATRRGSRRRARRRRRARASGRAARAAASVRSTSVASSAPSCPHGRFGGDRTIHVALQWMLQRSGGGVIGAAIGAIVAPVAIIAAALAVGIGGGGLERAGLARPGLHRSADARRRVARGDARAAATRATPGDLLAQARRCRHRLRRQRPRRRHVRAPARHRERHADRPTATPARRRVPTPPTPARAATGRRPPAAAAPRRPPPQPTPTPSPVRQVGDTVTRGHRPAARRRRAQSGEVVDIVVDTVDGAPAPRSRYRISSGRWKTISGTTQAGESLQQEAHRLADVRRAGSSPRPGPCSLTNSVIVGVDEARAERDGLDALARRAPCSSPACSRRRRTWWPSRPTATPGRTCPRSRRG